MCLFDDKSVLNFVCSQNKACESPKCPAKGESNNGGGEEPFIIIPHNRTLYFRSFIFCHHVLIQLLSPDMPQDLPSLPQDRNFRGIKMTTTFLNLFKKFPF